MKGENHKTVLSLSIAQLKKVFRHVVARNSLNGASPTVNEEQETLFLEDIYELVLCCCILTNQNDLTVENAIRTCEMKNIPVRKISFHYFKIFMTHYLKTLNITTIERHHSISRQHEESSIDYFELINTSPSINLFKQLDVDDKGYLTRERFESRLTEMCPFLEDWLVSDIYSSMLSCGHNVNINYDDHINGNIIDGKSMKNNRHQFNYSSSLSIDQKIGFGQFNKFLSSKNS